MARCRPFQAWRRIRQRWQPRSERRALSSAKCWIAPAISCSPPPRPCLPQPRGQRAVVRSSLLLHIRISIVHRLGFVTLSDYRDGLCDWVGWCRCLDVLDAQPYSRRSEASGPVAQATDRGRRFWQLGRTAAQQQNGAHHCRRLASAAPLSGLLGWLAHAKWAHTVERHVVRIGCQLACLLPGRRITYTTAQASPFFAP